MKSLFSAALYRYQVDGLVTLHCRVLKLADKPSCLGGEDKRDKRKVMG